MVRYEKTALLRSSLGAALLAAAASLAPAEENLWVSHGPTGAARINDLAIADSIAYAATPNGVFRSLDRGASWQRSGLAGVAIAQVVARNGGPVVLAHGYATLYASRDHGESWAPLSEPAYVSSVGINPHRPGTIYAVVERSIWKSTDAGLTWLTLPLPGGTSVEFAFDSRVTYAWRHGLLVKSVDGGVTWRGFHPPLESFSIATGAVDGVVYAAGSIGEAGRFCRSTDSAATWTCTVSPVRSVRRILEIPGPTPASPRLLVSTWEGAISSDDGGASWTTVGGGLEGNLQAFAVDSIGSLVLAGTDVQVLRSDDRGDTWAPGGAGLSAVSIGALALDPQRPSTIWAGGIGDFPSGPGLFRSTNGGLSWSAAGGAQGPQGIECLLIDPVNPRTMYAGWDSVFRTEDGGATWTSSLIPGSVGRLTALVIDPGDSRQVWASTGPGRIEGRHSGPWTETGAGLYVSDGARTWTRKAIEKSVYSILFDARRPGTIYAGSYSKITNAVSDYPYQSGGSIFVSHDSGATFTKNDFDFGRGVRSIAADPFDGDVLYLSTGSRVFRSTDRGATWQPGGNTNSINQIVADPVRPGRLYGSGNGVARSDDGGQTWQRFSEGLPNVGVGPLVISPDGRWLYVGTNGAGVFARDLEAPEPPQPCAASATRLCLAGNRYAVDLFAGRRGEPATTPGTARTLADRAGYFSLPFATGDAELPEVVVKILGHGALGLDGSPVFYSSLTTLPYRLVVTDTYTGATKTYSSDAAHPLCGAVDVAFEPEAAPAPILRAAAESESALPLLSGRFSVTLVARRASTGATAAGRAIASSDRYGFFTLPGFTSDPTLPEVIVKLLDFRSITGSFLFFYTGLTSLDYTLTVTDTVTGAVQTFESPGDYCGAVESLPPGS